MPAPISQIKEAILHPEGELRDKAIRYFSEARCDDESVMPIVIEAVEKYGRRSAFRILRNAARLPQSDASVDWLVDELFRELDLGDVKDDNHRFAVAWIIEEAPVPIVRKRLDTILAAPNFPLILGESLVQRIDLATWDWDRAWSALKSLGDHTMRRKEFSRSDDEYAARIVELLSRYRNEKDDFILACLEGGFVNEDSVLIDWLRPKLANVAGAMRLEGAVGTLMDWVGDISDDSLTDSAISALSMIDARAVLPEFDDRWPNADAEFRRAAAEILSYLRGDLCVDQTFDFFQAEEDYETKIELARALLANFAIDAIEPIGEILAYSDDDDWVPEQRGLAYHLVAVAMITGKTFPQFDQWQQAAQRDDWGRLGLEHGRVSEHFKPQPPGPKPSGNGKKHFGYW